MTEIRELVAEALYRRAWPKKQVWVQALPQDREEFLGQADTALSALVALSDQDTLAEWLYHRYATDVGPWGELPDEDKFFWEHEANAVRRAVARGGFKETR